MYDFAGLKITSSKVRWTRLRNICCTSKHHLLSDLKICNSRRIPRIIVQSVPTPGIGTYLGKTPTNNWRTPCCRFISGVSANINFVAIPIYIAECSREAVRGFLGSFVFTMVMIGVLVSYAIVPFLPIWTSSFIGAAVTLAYLVTYFWMPESPYYYLLKKKYDKAEESLRLVA